MLIPLIIALISPIADPSATLQQSRSYRCTARGGGSGVVTAQSTSRAVALYRRQHPEAQGVSCSVRNSSSSSSRGPVPIRIRAACALQADEEGATDIFLAYGPLDEENGARLVSLWLKSTNDRRRMAFIRCVNVNWNFK